MWLVVVIQIAVPLLMIGVITIIRQPSRMRWLVTVVAFGMVTSYLLISSRWDVSSLYLRALIPVLFIAAVIWSYRRIRVPETAPGKLQAVVAWTTSLGLIVLMSGSRPVSTARPPDREDRGGWDGPGMAGHHLREELKQRAFA